MLLQKNILQGKIVIGTNGWYYEIIDKCLVEDPLDGKVKLQYVVKSLVDGSLQLKPLYQIDSVV